MSAESVSQLDLAFSNGASAYRDGAGLAANPYAPDDKLLAEWRRGWVSAESRQIQTGIFGALRMMEDELRKGPKRYGNS